MGEAVNSTERLKEMLARADRACPEPWDNRCTNSLDNSATPRWIWSEYGWVGECIYPSAIENAEFIAASRTEHPMLCKLLIQAIEMAQEMAKPPYKNSDLTSLMQWVNANAGHFLSEVERALGGK